jgi:methionyl aminopeptidase
MARVNATTSGVAWRAAWGRRERDVAMILLKSREEIERMRASSGIVAEILAEVRARVRPGVSTAELDALAEELTVKKGARPAFKGYTVGGRPFPASICISINDEVVHGIPSERRVLREGDIVGLDFGVVCEGYFGDAAMTVPVGRVSPEAERLMQATQASLAAGIDAIRVGAHVGDISAAIQDTAEKAGYSLVREFVGHGIGRSLHEDPQVPNYRTGARGVRLQEGLVLAIEPMVNAGRPEVYVKEDGWTAATRDGRLSAHFEHSVAVTANGPYILSLP